MEGRETATAQAPEIIRNVTGAGFVNIGKVEPLTLQQTKGDRQN